MEMISVGRFSRERRLRKDLCLDYWPAALMDVRMSSTASNQKIKNDESECRQKGATSSHEIMYGPPRKSFSSFFLVHEKKQS